MLLCAGPRGRPTWQEGCCWQAGMLQPTAVQERREAEQAAGGGTASGARGVEHVEPCCNCWKKWMNAPRCAVLKGKRQDREPLRVLLGPVLTLTTQDDNKRWTTG